MEITWQDIYQTLLANEEIVVATVVGHSGSTPRTSGSKILIDSLGRSRGTIGGGAIEADVIRTARELFPVKRSILKAYNLNNISAVADMDLICGGRMQVLLEFISPDDPTIEIYKRVAEAEDIGNFCLSIGRLVFGKDEEHLVVERSVLTGHESWPKSFDVPLELQRLLELRNINHLATSLFESNAQQYVVDVIIPPKTIYLIGAGHVAREIAPLAKKASFRLIVVDDRAEFANAKRFPDAAKVIVCNEYSSVFENLHVDDNSYVVIVTRGHTHDKVALAQTLQTSAGYIGMIGSRKKRERVYKTLQAEGCDAGQLDRVHCPIGLSIDAETPFEIAVSIMAEIIQHRANSKG